MKQTDEGFDFDLTPESDDTLFSPSGDDKLLIEGEEIPAQETAPVEVEEAATEENPTTDNEPAEQETAPAEEQPVETPVEEKDEEKKPEPVVPTNPKKKGNKKQKPSENKKSGSALPFILLLLLCAGGGAAWYYFSYMQPKPAPEPVAVDTTNVVVEEPVVEIPAEPMVIDTVPAPEPTPPPFDFGRVATKIKVPRGWLVGYRATPDEVLAIQTVAELSYVDSLPCGYYWIDDARHDGQKLFKIYVGPYETKADAEAALPLVQAKRADAHVYTEDKRYK